MVKDERIKNGDELLYSYCTDASIANLCFVCKWEHVTLGPDHANVLGCLILGSAVKSDTGMELA